MRRILIGIICLWVSGAAHAWFSEGHLVVGQMAYNHLTPSVQTACNNLLAVSLAPYDDPDENTFATSSVWADSFKASLHSSNAHFFNLPFSLDSSSTTTAWNNTLAFTQDVVRGTRQCILLLQSSTASQKDKAIALRYLIHYVGDVHQPLHGVTYVNSTHATGDAGGNGFALSYFDGNQTLTNLHALWDAGAGYVDKGITLPLSAGEQTTINNIISDIEATYPYVANPGVPNLMDWVQEDLTYARTICYVGITTGTTPNASYIGNTTATCKLRLAQAGHRLADLLNTIMPSSSDIATPDVTEPELLTITGNGSTTPGALAVDASGNLIVWDSATTPNLLHMAPDGMDDNISSFMVTTQAAILTAIDAANGTITLPTSFSVSTIQMAADGDVIVLGLTNTSEEVLLSIPNSASPAITVVATRVSGGANPIDGASDFCMSGNTAYLCLDSSFGASEDKIIALNTNDGSAPTPTVNIISTQAQLNTGFALSGSVLRPGPIAMSPSGVIWLSDSNATATDAWTTISTGTGAAALAINKTNTLNALIAQGYTSVTDVGYSGAVFSSSGNLYCLNQFGAGTSDDSVIEFATPGAGTVTHIRNRPQVQIDMGSDGAWTAGNTFGGGTGTNAIAYSAVNQRIYYVLSTTQGSKGIASIRTTAPLPVELAGFSAE